MEVVKSYQKSLGAKACWTCCNENGEIAAACLVQSTKAIDLAHAAGSLFRREDFRPKVMYADTWPHLKNFWKLLYGPTVCGRLGLFHFMQRIIKTMSDRK